MHLLVAALANNHQNEQKNIIAQQNQYFISEIAITITANWASAFKRFGKSKPTSDRARGPPAHGALASAHDAMRIAGTRAFQQGADPCRNP
jgi:hypothetical protein